MPIQFHCPNCNHLLQTPDGSEGKKARCPSCSHVVDVPDPHSLPPQNTPSSPHSSDIPLPPSTPPDQEPLWDTAPPQYPDPYATRDPDQEFNPFAAPASPAKEYLAPRSGDGPPWERDGASAQTFIETAKLIFTSPTNTFAQMRREGGFGYPLLYSLIGTAIGTLSSMVFYWMFIGVLGLLDADVDMADGAFAVGNSFGQGLCSIILSPVGMFISAGLLHVFLHLYGGANYGFETTFRATCYSHGTLQLAHIIPCVGALIASIGGIIVTIIGLANMHQTSGGKATAAALSPIIVCCAAAGIFAMIAFSTIN